MQLPTGGSAALVLLALAYTLGSRTLAAIGALPAIYFIWSFYWDLDGTLLTKSIILMSAGAVLLLCYGLLVGTLRERRRIMKRARWMIALAGLALILVLANWDIAQKRAVIADGQVLLLELRPADPRSLFQGDYMRLALADAAMPSETIIDDLPYRGTVILPWTKTELAASRGWMMDRRSIQASCACNIAGTRSGVAGDWTTARSPSFSRKRTDRASRAPATRCCASRRTAARY